jgi:undecaprenyl-diphosphatase
MLGGSVLVTFGYLLSFEASAEAFDVSARFATLGAVYLFGSAVATIAPTPGGLGATEAAMVGGLVAVGVPNSQAVPAVFLFRLVTFWLPILPGWISYNWLRRIDRL